MINIVEERDLANGAHLLVGMPGDLEYAIGQVLSVPGKLALFEPRVGAHPSQETIDDLVEVVGHNDRLKNATIRVGHCNPYEDVKKLFTDERIKNEVPLYMRVLGAPVTLLASSLSHIGRNDHYNPFTHTIHLMSDVSSIGLHEAGHADDYANRYHSRLPYNLFGATGVGTLWQEGVATKYAHDTLPEGKKYELGRYLFPAFGTYIGYVTGIGFAAGAVGGLLVGLGLNFMKSGVLSRAYDKVYNRVFNRDVEQTNGDSGENPESTT